MHCYRANCHCLVDATHRFVWKGKMYCKEQCAKECTDEQCVCTPCDCSKVG